MLYSEKNQDFDYLAIASHHWADALAQMKASGARSVKIRIPWGAHENVQGMRDFSRSSRLRLEKVLKTVSDSQLKAEIFFGFSSGKEMIPTWAYATPQKTFAPAQAWDEAQGGFSLVEIPSLFDAELWDSFAEFSEEVVKLSSLYVSPQGPVENIQMDLHVFSLDCEMFSSEEFCQVFQELYPSVESVNAKYNVILKNSAPIISAQSFRVLYKSRSWLASFDYKFCRSHVLARLKEKALALQTSESLEGKFEVRLEPPSYGRARKNLIAIDSVFLEFSNNAPLPFFPHGLVSQQSAYAFRVAEYFYENAERFGYDFSPLPLTEERDSGDHRFAVVICGKYLTRASYRYLEKVWMRGGNVFFPFGLPQFDEHMQTFDWLSPGEKGNFKIGDLNLHYSVRGLGKVWSAVPALALAQSVWENIDTVRTGIESIR